MALLIVLCAGASSLCNAEKIYCKDARIVDTNILYRTRGSVWVKQAKGAVGINIEDIDRIVNDDGTLSKYDYKSLSGAIKEFIVNKNYKGAVGLCGILLESFPNDTQIHYLRGLLNQKVGNFQQAIEDYTFLIRQEAADAQILNNLGAIYANKKEAEEAQALFIDATRKNPDMVEVHSNLAALSLKTKQFGRAIDEYNKVIEKEPDNINALYNLGIAYMNSKNYSMAQEQWGKILVIDPDNNEAKNALAYLKIKN